MTARRVLSRWGIWAIIALAVTAALIVGSSRPSHPTLQQRTMSLASQVRCPVCGGESAAQSQVAAAVDIRTQIHEELAAGTPPGQVLDHIVQAYGTGILERPPAQGIGIVVWVLPVAVMAAAAGGLVLAFARWRRSRPAVVPGGGGGAVPAAGSAAEVVAAGGAAAGGAGTGWVRAEDEALVARALAGDQQPAGPGAWSGPGPGPGQQ